MPEASATSAQFVDEILSSDKFGTFIKTLLAETINEHLSSLTTQVKELSEKVMELNDEVEKLKGQNHDLEVKNKELNDKVTSTAMQHVLMNNNLKKLCNEHVEITQYSRRNCVIVTGVPEKKDENTDEIIKELANEKMSVPLEDSDIDRTHRLGKPEPGKTRAIVAKFTRYNTRQQFVQNRKKLKGSKIGIHDLLNPFNKNLLKQAQILVTKCNHVTAAWSWDGKIYVRVNVDGRIKKIPVLYGTDLNKLYDRKHPMLPGFVPEPPRNPDEIPRMTLFDTEKYEL